MDGADRRIWPRTPMRDCIAHITLVPRMAEVASRARLHCPVRDMSRGGVAVTSNVFLPVGTSANLVFEGIVDTDVRFPAVVRWVREEPATQHYVAGFEFKHKDAPRANAFSTLMVHNLRQPSFFGAPAS